MAERIERRQHDRIEIEMHTRLSLSEDYRGHDIEFEGFAKTRNLSIGGAFIESTYLLPVGFPMNLEMKMDEREMLVARGEVVHSRGEESGFSPGMGIRFTYVDADNRERLLRYFVSDRIRSFYEERFVLEFPHLRERVSLRDIALIVNLWEDKQERLKQMAQVDRLRATSGRAEKPVPPPKPGGAKKLLVKK